MPIEDAITSSFMPALLNANPHQPDSLRSLMALPVKFGGIGICDPTTTADRHNHRSTSCTSVLSDAIISTNDEWVYLDHYCHLMNMKEEGRKANHIANQTTLNDLTDEMTPQCKRAPLRSQSTGSWLSITPSRVNGLDLSKGEFRDGVSMRYGLDILDLPQKCDGCGVKFSKSHALGCKKGDLVLGRHDDLKNEVAYLAKLATNNGSVRDEPIINIGRDAPTGPPASARFSPTNRLPSAPASPKNPPSNDRGDILIRGFFEKTTDCVIDVRVTDSDSPSKIRLDPI